MWRFWKGAVVIGGTAVGMVNAAAARADWYINGQWQPLIPFWFTLEEAIMAYYGLL